MDNENHNINIREFLVSPFRTWCARTGYQAFVGGNSFVYYGPDKKRDVLGPDLYVVNGGVARGQEKWIAALEGGLLPSLVMEFLSDSTRRHDRNEKFATYRDTLKCADCFLIDDGPSIDGFHLRNGVYVPVLPGPNGRIQCSSLPLELGVHEGWVRWFDSDGRLLLTGAEEAEIERSRADAERQRTAELEAQVRALQAALDSRRD